ncbi:MAG TPA: hypothetical protein VNA57_03510 [Acidimicrobiales bacterium]|nr:hypothetical protein [Acidimicrobiales bacterium]
MPGRSSYRVAYRHEGKLYRLTRIVYGADGSYYVTAPIHPEEKAQFVKMTVNYAKQQMEVPLEEAVDLAGAAAEDKEIKLSHHPDGFMQFSGAGLVSGREADGTIRGMGVMTWPFWDPIRGPAFGLALTRFEDFVPETTESADTVVFDDADVTRLDDADVLSLEGYYFPPLWRRFIRLDANGRPVIRVFHPAKAVLELRVLLPHAKCELPGFLGIELYTQYSISPAAEDERPDDAEHGYESKPGFIFSGSTGNLRRNEAGELLGDGIYCMYPVHEIAGTRNLDFPPDYLMKEVDPLRQDGPIADTLAGRIDPTGPGTI